MMSCLARWRQGLVDRRGAVALIFALSALPLLMVVGLVIDYAFFAKVQSQLNLAADTAAMQAVRVASEVSSINSDGTTKSPSDYQAAVQQAGQQAGQQWFQAQMGNLVNGSVPAGNIAVTVSYNPLGSRYTSTVSYTGTVPTHFGALFHVASFNVAGVATAVISNAFAEVLMLLDNSSSMLIPSTSAGIAQMESLTPCATKGVDNIHPAYLAYPYPYPNLPSDFWYKWKFTSGYGYNYPSSIAPPSSTTNGQCGSGYTGDPAACLYLPSALNVDKNNTWRCTNKGGLYTKPPNQTKSDYYAQAPCAFACHSDVNNNDFFGLSRDQNIELRLDVVQEAVANVISTLNDRQQPNQFSVGVYTFSNSLSAVWPISGEATTDLATALAKAKAMTPPVTAPGITANTNFPASFQTLTQNVANAGDGTTPSTPLKNLFIITDGVNDPTQYNFNAIGPMSVANSDLCGQLWAKGFNIYVLYTPYLPLPATFYQLYVMPWVESTDPTNPMKSNVAALQACARFPTHFYVASDKTAINTAMQKMLAAALNSPGRVAK